MSHWDETPKSETERALDSIIEHLQSHKRAIDAVHEKNPSSFTAGAQFMAEFMSEIVEREMNPQRAMGEFHGDTPS